MKPGVFTIYKSSAGAGKTRTLAKSYLSIALAGDTYAFKTILAITFTNKATQEMKDRILSYLRGFSSGQEDPLANELCRELKISKNVLGNRAEQVLSAILHEYSHFAVCTIDAFFQKIIRAFTKEVGIGGGYRLELDQAHVLNQVVDSVIEQVGKNPSLTSWVAEYANHQLSLGRSWDIRHALRGFAQEILREDFRLIEGQIEQMIHRPTYFTDLQTTLRQTITDYLDSISVLAKKGLAYIDKQGWTQDDFKYSGGAYNFFQKMTLLSNTRQLDNKNIGSRVRKEFLESKHWPNKDSLQKDVIEDGALAVLIPILKEILSLRDNGYCQAVSAELLLSQVYSFGLMADVAEKLREFKADNNILLLSDASRLLHVIIQGSDTPFVYEKMGSYYDHFLIDEFQDTSLLQWNNLLPLLAESLDNGKSGMIVGDVKQSVYRWRGGDLMLLHDQAQQDLGADRVEVKELTSNFRSASQLVGFNNNLFSTLSGVLAKKENNSLAADAYSGVSQMPIKKSEGEVAVDFVASDEHVDWKEVAMDKMLDQIHRLGVRGVGLEEITILVRKNKEGQQIARRLTSHGIPVISNESLLVKSSRAVQLLFSALQWISNPKDVIRAAELLHQYCHIQGVPVPFSSMLEATPESYLKLLPEDFQKQFKQFPFFPVYEITESLVSIFNLGSKEEVAFLESFQSAVLEFSSKERNDLAGFLTYWEDKQETLSIQMPDTMRAIRIMSIHQSKGLQFKYVIIPFCHWELDHPIGGGPMLWVHAHDSMGYVPMRYSQLMKDSFFNDRYEDERKRCLLDGLNLLYVAFTRAELGLYVTAPQNTHAGRVQSSVAKELLDLFLNHADFQPCMHEYSFSLGSFTKEPAHTTTRNTVMSESYPCGFWRTKLTIRSRRSPEPVLL